MIDDEDRWWEKEQPFSAPHPLEQLTGAAFGQNESLRILGLVAVTLTRLAEWPSGEEFSPPYEAVAQMAVDRICLAGLRRFPDDQPGEERRYPRSLPDLLAWCRDREVQDWGFLSLPDDLHLQGGLLVRETFAPSRLCHELACRYEHADPTGKSIRDLLITQIRELYAQAGVTGGPYAFVRTLVESPVLTTSLMARFKLRRERIPEEAIAACYVPVYDRYYDEQGRANVCASCGLLRILVKDEWRCEITACPDRQWRQGGEFLDGAEGLYHATRPLREFVIAPRRIYLAQQRSPMTPDAPRDLGG